MKKILVVDDTHRTLRDAEEALRSQGYDVVTAPSAEKGLEILNGGGVDLAILDYRMPEMDGVQMLCAMRKNKDHTPVIFSTNMMPVSLREMAEMFGVHDFLDKNFHSDQTKNAVLRILGKDTA